jgi:hypothetical protein
MGMAQFMELAQGNSNFGKTRSRGHKPFPFFSKPQELSDILCEIALG